MAKVFSDFDMEHFWEPSDYGLKEYVGAPLTDAAVAAVEQELEYKLPASYVEFMRFQNGGILVGLMPKGDNGNRPGDCVVSGSKRV